MRVPVLATYGMWNVWCREVFSDEAMACRDPFYIGHERTLRMQLFQHEVGDDSVLEPWLTQPASRARGWGNAWGVEETHSGRVEGGSWQFRPPVAQWSDVAKLIQESLANACRHSKSKRLFAEQRLDGNVLRVVARVTNDAGDISAGRTRARFREIAQQWLDPRQPGQFNQALMELGATLCAPRNPQCLMCPLAALCRTCGEHKTPTRPRMLSKEVARALADSFQDWRKCPESRHHR